MRGHGFQHEIRPLQVKADWNAWHFSEIQKREGKLYTPSNVIAKVFDLVIGSTIIVALLRWLRMNYHTAISQKKSKSTHKNNPKAEYALFRGSLKGCLFLSQKRDTAYKNEQDTMHRPQDTHSSNFVSFKR